MNITGSIIELKNNKALIMTENCEFVNIKRQPGMYEGLEITFSPKEICDYKKTILRYSSFVGSTAALFIVVFLYLRLSYLNSIYAYIDIDINPSIELTINKNDAVLEASPLNDDGKKVLKELVYKNKPFETVFEDIVNKSKEFGYINTEKENNVILLSVALNKSKNKTAEDMEAIIENCRKAKISIQDLNITSQLIEVMESDRKIAQKNHMSMGRYSLYKRTIDNGINMSLDEAKIININSILSDMLIETMDDFNALSSTSPKASDNSAAKATPKITPKVTGTAASSVNTDDKYTLPENNNTKDAVTALEKVLNGNKSAQREIESIKKKSAEDINRATKATEAKIKEISSSSLNQEQKDKLILEAQEELNEKIKAITNNEKDQALSVVNKLKEKTDGLLSNDKDN